MNYVRENKQIDNLKIKVQTQKDRPLRKESTICLLEEILNRATGSKKIGAGVYFFVECGKDRKITIRVDEY